MPVVRNELACWAGAATAVVFLLFGKGLADLGHVTWYGFLLAAPVVLIFA
jgi:hypothetical protein